MGLQKAWKDAASVRFFGGSKGENLRENLSFFFGNRHLFDPVVADAIVGIVQGRFDDQIPRAGQDANGPNRRAGGENLDDIADGIEMDRAAVGGGGRGRRGRQDDDGDDVDIQIDPDDETDLAIRNVLDEICHGVSEMMIWLGPG